MPCWIAQPDCIVCAPWWVPTDSLCSECRCCVCTEHVCMTCCCWRTVLCVCVCVCVCLLIAMRHFGGFFSYFGVSVKRLLFPLSTSKPCSGSRESSRLVKLGPVRLVLIRPEPKKLPTSYRNKQLEDRHMFNTFQRAVLHTRRCNIFTGMYNDKYKKAIPTKEDNIDYSSSLLCLFVCTIIAIRRTETERCPSSRRFCRRSVRVLFWTGSQSFSQSPLSE